jgi:hypothetical protein
MLIYESRLKIANNVTWYKNVGIPGYKILRHGYRIVNDIAAERSFTPSVSHLDCGAVAPAITTYRIKWHDNLFCCIFYVLENIEMI